MTINDAIESFLSGESMNSERTGTTYRTALRRFTQFLAEQDIAPARPASVLSIEHARKFTTWLAHDYRTRAGRRLSPAAMGLYLTTLLLFYDHLIIEGQITETDNYVKLRKWIRDHIKVNQAPIETKLPPDAVVEALIEAVDAPPVMPDGIAETTRRRRVLAGLRDRAIIYSLRTSGARVGELMGLRRGDLNVDDRGAWVTGKGNKVRFIRFSAPAWQAIIAYLEARKDKGGVDKLPLFCRHDRAAGVKLLPLTTLSVERIINRLAEAAGVAERFNMTPHSFRHYFATQFLQATGNLALTQDALGHANPSTTRIYAKTTKNNLIDAHKKMFGD